MADHSKVLAVIAKSTDPDQLRRIPQNAIGNKAFAVADAAFRRLLDILPGEAPGSIEHDFWKTIHAFEEILRQERGKTVRLSRTRQKIDRVGVRQTWAPLSTPLRPALF